MLRKLLVQHAGEPLDRDKLHGSLEALYATGRFATLQVEAEDVQQNGLTLVFVVTENYFYGDINVDGTPKKTSPKPHQLVDSSKLDLGTVFSREEVDRAVGRMQKVMADNGYYNAAITYELKPNDQTRQMQIEFHVVPGLLARVGQVTIEGDTGIPVDKVRSLTELKTGAAVKQQNVTRALERLRKHYQKNDHLEAQVSLIEHKYQRDANRLDYVFKVEEGPTVAITTEGAKISKGELKKLVPVYQENSVDDDLLNEGRRNLRDYLQIKGYFDVNVDLEQHPTPAQNHLNILYVIDPGERHKLAAVKVEGNRYFDTETITERMTVQPASLLLPYGRFSQRLLTGDLASIKYLYQSNGFLDVKVNSELQSDYEGRPGRNCGTHQDRRRPADAGQLTASCREPQLPAGPIAAAVEQPPKSTLQRGEYRSRPRHSHTFLLQPRFPECAVRSCRTPAPNQPQRMNVAYTITEGQQVFVDRGAGQWTRELTRRIVGRETRVH